MTIPSVPREAIQTALQVFDNEHRDTAQWRNWQANKNHHYAIDEGDKLYPVKEIVSLATGMPVAEFSGGIGTGQANQYVEDRGFKITELNRRNPPWSRDELILALDVYLRNRDAPPGPASKEITDLSALLNQLGGLLHDSRYETYRNPNGVAMKLMNFRRLDPDYAESKGLPHGSKLDIEIWNEFSGDPAHCHQAANAIRNGATELETEENGDTEPDDPGIVEAEEGRVVTRVHRRRERNRKLVAQKKKSVQKTNGTLACEACGFDFAAVYGDRGAGFAECHHEKPIHALKPGEKTHIDDLRIVCANCHRMIHSQRPWLSIDELKAMAGIEAIRKAMNGLTR